MKFLGHIVEKFIFPNRGIVIILDIAYASEHEGICPNMLEFHKNGAFVCQSRALGIERQVNPFNDVRPLIICVEKQNLPNDQIATGHEVWQVES